MTLAALEPGFKIEQLHVVTEFGPFWKARVVPSDPFTRHLADGSWSYSRHRHQAMQYALAEFARTQYGVER